MNFFKDLTSGFSSFVVAWLVPSAVVSSILVFFVMPSWIAAGIGEATSFGMIRNFLSSGPGAVFGSFALLVTILALTSSLSSRWVYRILEGYSLPRSLARPMVRRQLRRKLILHQRALNTRLPIAKRALALEQLANYPENRDSLMPTKLGNALRALEDYGSTHYCLDSQSAYYELCAVVPEQTIRDVDQTRAAVDFFVSFTGLLSTCALIAGLTGLATGDTAPLVTSILAILASRVSYLAAVQNMTDCRYASQALVNIGRVKLAEALGYELPAHIEHELAFWSAWMGFIERLSGLPLAEQDYLRRSETEAPEVNP